MYRIEITHVTKEEVSGKEYHRVADTGNPRDGGPVYDYVPCDKVAEHRRTVLLQEVASLDIAAVIRAVNGLERPLTPR